MFDLICQWLYFHKLVAEPDPKSGVLPFHHMPMLVTSFDA